MPQFTRINTNSLSAARDPHPVRSFLLRCSRTAVPRSDEAPAHRVAPVTFTTTPREVKKK